MDSTLTFLEYDTKMVEWLEELYVNMTHCVNDSAFSFFGHQPLGDGFIAGLIHPETMQTSRILGGELSRNGDVKIFFRSTLENYCPEAVERIVMASIPMLDSAPELEKIMEHKARTL